MRVDARLRSWWYARQGLDGSLAGCSSADVLRRAGWARGVGGANPYLTLFSRAGISPRDAEASSERLDFVEIPSARGCTYFVPMDQVPYGLALAREVHDRLSSAEKAVGLTVQEIDALCDRVLDSVGDRPMTPAEIKDVVGDAVRNFGEEGKKRGITTSLPSALMRLQVRGLIWRVPEDNRFDTQRYGYCQWNVGDLPSGPEAIRWLAKEYWRWTGCASLAHFQWLSGLGVKASQEAIAGLGLVPMHPDSEFLAIPDSVAEFAEHGVSSEPQYSMVSSIDSCVLLRRNSVQLLGEEHLGAMVFGEKGLRSAGSLTDLPANAILDRGTVIGWWEFDPDAGRILTRFFGQRPAGVKNVIDATEAIIRGELGDCRSFSLDSPKSRRPLLDWLRE